MSDSKPRCPMCEDRRVRKLVSVTIEGRQFELCRQHAAEVEQAAVTTLAELDAHLAAAGLDRRQRDDRRRHDRRMFPPRPESRRHNAGRRASDPSY